MASDRDGVIGQFEKHRDHLKNVAYRMLGSASDAEDAVQEAWLRVSQADADAIENVRGWLTTIVARVSLNMLRSRNARREAIVEPDEFIRAIGSEEPDAEHEAVLADSVGLALLVVLERLTPAERLAFVLHDMFDLSFDEIATVVGRTPAAARQLASRARRRVRGVDAAPDSDLRRRTTVVDAFLSASRRGDFNALVALLDPDVVLDIDRPLRGAEHRPVRGAAALIAGARGFARAARFCQVAVIDGKPGLVMAPRGRLLRVSVFSFTGDRVARIEVIGDPERLRRLEIAIPGPPGELGSGI